MDNRSTQSPILVRDRPWMNSSLSPDKRAALLLAQMTLDEKLAQLNCLWSTAFVDTGSFDPNVVLKKIPHGIGQVTRIGASTGLHPQESAAFMNAIQQVAVERTRLGIPVIVHEESTGGFCHRDATVFPQGIGLAATWNPDLVKQVAQVIRTQMMAVGARHALAPVLDVARDPRWGRVEESYGEDPVLTGTLGIAYVQGLQSEDLRQGVAATAKHFLGYSIALALQAGMDMELPAVECYGEPLKAEVEAGRVPLEVVDRSVLRVLQLKLQLGLFEHPYVDAAFANTAFGTSQQRTLAHQAVAESVILLSNDGVLPLAPTLKRLAVIGPGADDVRLLQGDYHYPSHLEMIYAPPQKSEDLGDFADLDLPQAGGAYAPGPYFSIGASSADIRAEQTVTLDGQVVEYRQREIVATKVGLA
jgi:beta-glucosidase-like glycosyl hydrolase